MITRRCERFAGSDEQRLADLNALAQLPGENLIVMPVRGGYGASRLLSEVNWQAIAERQQQQPLLICGHSDFTAFQSGLLATGNVITFSGPMLAGNFGAEPQDAFTVEHFGGHYAIKPIPWNGKAKARIVTQKASFGAVTGHADFAYWYTLVASNRRRHSGGGRYQ